MLTVKSLLLGDLEELPQSAIFLAVAITDVFGCEVSLVEQQANFLVNSAALLFGKFLI